MIALCLIACGLCGIGLIEFYAEGNVYKLWIPTNTDFVEDSEWLAENFPPDKRYNNAILAGDNVLTPEILREVQKISVYVGFCTGIGFDSNVLLILILC